MRRNLTSDLWLILIMVLVVIVLWFDVQQVKQLAESVRAQNIAIEKLNNGLEKFRMELGGGNGGWEVGKVGKETGH